MLSNRLKLRFTDFRHKYCSYFGNFMCIPPDSELRMFLEGQHFLARQFRKSSVFSGDSSPDKPEWMSLTNRKTFALLLFAPNFIMPGLPIYRLQ